MISVYLVPNVLALDSSLFKIVYEINMQTCVNEINVDLPSLLFGWEAEMSSQNDCKSFARNNFMSEEFNLLNVTFCRLLIPKLELLQCRWDFVTFPDSCQCQFW